MKNRFCTQGTRVLQAEDKFNNLAATSVVSGDHPPLSRWMRYADLGLRAAWFINLAALIGICVWAYVDARFMPAGYALRAATNLDLDDEHTDWVPNTSNIDDTTTRLIALLWIAGILINTWLWLGLGLISGPKLHRRLRSWLAFMALIAAWLAVWTNWPEIAWLGQQRRLRAELPEFEAMATSLHADWPAQDGEHPLLGPYMAYPIGLPTVLLLPNPPESTKSGIKIAAIEHHPTGGLCFQLAAAETGAWLEWHPPGQSPQSFTGGLFTEYRLERSTQITPEWFLVRYFEPSTHELDLLRSHRRHDPK
jgi:hypothetical protein